MTVNTTYREDQKGTHEKYAEQWQVMRDWYNYEIELGPFACFSNKIKYLPLTSGLAKDIKANTEPAYTEAVTIYNRYHLQAITDSKGFFRKSVDGAVNTIHREESEYFIPTAFEYFLENATDRKESLKELHRNITHNQCLVSRQGLLLEINTDKGNQSPEFFSVLYDAERVLGWGWKKGQKAKELSFVIIDTTENADDQETYLVLAMRDNRYFQVIKYSAPDVSTYDPDEEIVEDDDYIVYSGQYLDEIPFVFCCATDLRPNYEIPKFSTSAYLDWSYLMKAADRNQHLHENSQGLWMFAGFQDEEINNLRLGAGALNSSMNPDASASHVGVDPSGIEAGRQALLDIEESASAENITSMKQVSGESGIARVTIMEARTLPLVDIALTGAAAIQKLFGFMAKWANLNEEEFRVEQNLNFFSRDIDSALLRELMAVKVAGGPVTNTMIINLLKKSNLTSQEVDEIVEEIKKEKIIETEEITQSAEVE